MTEYRMPGPARAKLHLRDVPGDDPTAHELVEWWARPVYDLHLDGEWVHVLHDGQRTQSYPIHRVLAIEWLEEA